MNGRPPGGDPEIAARLVGIYPNPEVRSHMREECMNLAVRAGMTGRPEALAWMEIASALRLSLHPSYPTTGG